MPAMKFRRPVALARIKRIEQTLSEGPKNVDDIATATFSSIAVAQRYMTHLRQQRRVHIAGWDLRMSHDRPFGYVFPLYAAGDLPDAPLPTLKQ